MQKEKRKLTDKVYVLGFAFSDNLNHVLLIDKIKGPETAQGLNGIGGEIKTGEFVIQAISRETKEETGLDILPTEWLQAGQLFMGGVEIVVLTTATDAIFKAQTITDEAVSFYSRFGLADPTSKYADRKIAKYVLQMIDKCVELIQYERIKPYEPFVLGEV